ncbi:MAG: hypothetical protein ABIO70_15985 [Pseudomonadota bacterium]
MHPTAAMVVKHHLSVAARRLGVADPLPTLGGALDRTFQLPVGDPRYGNNALAPGSMPFELSYSEVSPRNLRFDLELGGPQASPEARRHETSRETRRLIHQHFGQPALRWFDERSEPWRTGPVDMGARFGAFFGASFDDGGLNEAKAYYEFRPDQVAALPDNLQHAVRVTMAALPGLVPIFTSIAAGRQRGAQRVYLFCPEELRLLDLEPLMHRLGIGHQLPSILAALGVITGGRFTLPAGSAVLGLRDTPRGIEMKLDLLMPAFSDPPQNMHGLIQLHLAQRPDSQRSLHDWMQAVTPDDRAGPGDISVVGVKVNPKMPSRLAVYLRPDEARPRRVEPSTRRAPSHFALDPFSNVQA